MKLPWYFITDLLLCLATGGVIRWSWPNLGPVNKWSAVSAASVIMILQTANELISRKIFHAWTFSFEHNCMIGLNFLGEPLEEYLFWWAYAWLIPFGYCGLIAWFNQRDQARGVPVDINV
jgi:hypothetical protein